MTLVAIASSRVTIQATSFENDLLPDKKTDAWTTSSRFKRDLATLFPENKGETVLELGAHVGHCTRVLSRLFGSVIAVEHSDAVIEKNVQHTSDLANIVHLKFHTALDDWSLLSRGRIGVVFIDAAHDYHSVKSDIANALDIPTVHTLVLDDYGAERGVHAAVSEALSEGIVQVKRYIGEPPPWHFSGRTVDEWEGIVLEPMRGADRVTNTLGMSALFNTTWVVFPAGVFVSGYFQPHGLIHFVDQSTASSSYGPLAWREAMPHEAGQEDGVCIVRLEEENGWRGHIKFNDRRTAGILFRGDGHELVLLRQEMMRTVGEKLLSFMH